MNDLPKEGQKWCPRCSTWKDAPTEFYRYASRYSGYCKACTRLHAVASRDADKHRDTMREWQRKRRGSTRVNKRSSDA